MSQKTERPRQIPVCFFYSDRAQGPKMDIPAFVFLIATGACFFYSDRNLALSEGSAIGMAPQPAKPASQPANQPAGAFCFFYSDTVWFFSWTWTFPAFCGLFFYSDPALVFFGTSSCRGWEAAGFSRKYTWRTARPVRPLWANRPKGTVCPMRKGRDFGSAGPQSKEIPPSPASPGSPLSPRGGGGLAGGGNCTGWTSSTGNVGGVASTCNTCCTGSTARICCIFNKSTVYLINLMYI